MSPDDMDKYKQDDKDEVFDPPERDAEGSDRSSIGSPAPSNAQDDMKKSKTKSKRKRLLKDVNAPKAPLTGYVRFLNEHREKFREEHPDMPFHEVTRVLGQQWSSMSQEEKQQYLDEAEKEKGKYMKTLEGYQQSSAYKEFQELKKRKEAEYHDENNAKHMKVGTKIEAVNVPKANGILKPLTQGPKITTESGAQIPVFTEQFLEYSRQRESELRHLRKNNSLYEEQHAILNKQIDHMKSVMDRVKTEIIQQENESISMQTYLNKFRKVLIDLFQTVNFPPRLSTEKLTCENIDTKLTLLVDYLANGKSSEAIDLKKKVRELVSNIDYPALKD